MFYVIFLRARKALHDIWSGGVRICVGNICFMAAERFLFAKNYAKKCTDSFSVTLCGGVEKLSQTYFELSLRYFKICLR